MDKQVKRIKAALDQLSRGEQQQDDEEIGEALNQIDSSLDQLTGHPRSESIREALAQTAEQLNQEEGTASTILHRLHEDLADYEEAHPNVTLLIGRLANALAVYGL